MRCYDGQFPATPKAVAAIRGEVRAVAEECGLEGQALYDVVLAVSEAVSNAVVHGAGGDEPCVRVSVRLARGEIEVVVCDDGGGVKPRSDSPGAGLGLPLIASVSTRLSLVSGDHGTEVHMTFPCPNAMAA
jgi:serine/threonine-protein kinase RsbW